MSLAKDGRVVRDLQEVREAVRHFVDIYTREWLMEKNGPPKPHSLEQFLEQLNENVWIENRMRYTQFSG
jgi:hypothetical protein